MKPTMKLKLNTVKTTLVSVTTAIMNNNDFCPTDRFSPVHKLMLPQISKRLEMLVVKYTSKCFVTTNLAIAPTVNYDRTPIDLVEVFSVNEFLNFLAECRLLILSIPLIPVESRRNHYLSDYTDGLDLLYGTIRLFYPCEDHEVIRLKDMTPFNYLLNGDSNKTYGLIGDRLFDPNVVLPQSIKLIPGDLNGHNSTTCKLVPVKELPKVRSTDSIGSLTKNMDILNSNGGVVSITVRDVPTLVMMDIESYNNLHK